MTKLLRLRLLAFAAVGAVLLGLAAHLSGVLEEIELDTVDARFELRGERPPPEDLVVVAIDDVTFDELERPWPFPRSLHARLIDRLTRAGAAVIAYDVQFTEPTEPEEDEALFEAIYRAGPMVLATTEFDEEGRTAILGGEANLRSVGAEPADATLEPDRGGVLRRVPSPLPGLATFAAATARLADGARVDVAPPRRSEAWIDYAGGPGSIRTLSFSDVVRGRVPAAELQGRIVVVGASAPSLQDVHATPTAGRELMAGPEVQAHAIQTARAGFPLHRPGDGLDVPLVVLMGLLGPAAAFLLGYRGGWLVIALGAIALPVGVQVAFEEGVIVALVSPMLALLTGAVGVLATQHAAAAFDRERVRDVFRRFVGDAVVSEVLSEAREAGRLAAVRRNATVVFCDLRGFTTFSEGRASDEVVRVLNRYYATMTDAILEQGGTLSSFLGDGIMALFGAPLEQDDHADRALRAARDMVRRLDEFNAWVLEEGLAEPFAMGIGMHSGPLMAGQVGSDRRMEYTAIGDTVNTASRLESLTKELGVPLVLSGATVRSLLRRPPDLVELGDHKIRGRREGVAVWGLRAPVPDPVPDAVA